MGKGGGGGGGTNGFSMQINQSLIPSWLTDASKTATANATSLATTPQTPYNGELTAPLNSAQTQAGNIIGNTVGAYQPAFQDAASAVTGSLAPVSNITPQTYANGLTSPTFAQNYMNPYTQSVIDASRAAGARALDQNLNQIKDSAVTAKAFGGSRDLVQRGGAAADNALGQQQLAAQLLNQNYGQATNLLGQDITNNQSAQATNQTAQLQNQKNLQTGGLALGQVAQGSQASMLQDINNLLGYGSLAQNTQQAGDTAGYQSYLQQLQYPLQTQQLLAGTLSAVPHDTTTTSAGISQQQQQGSSSPLSSILGGVSSLLGLGGQAGLFGGGTAASGIGSVLGGGGSGLLGGLLGFLSDENMKTDVEKLGKDPQTGLTLHAYRYKGDPKSYPKVVGPMAQEVEKKFPGATRKVGGRMVVNGLSGGMGA